MHVNNIIFAYYDETFDLILPITDRQGPIIHCESKKGCHPNHSYNFVISWWIWKILSLL